MANYPRPADALSTNRLMLQQRDGSFAEAPAMTAERKTFFGQLAYFDGAPHLVLQGGPYPLAWFRLGDATPLPVEVRPDGGLFDVSDVAVADFDGDPSTGLFAASTSPELNA